MRPCVSFDGAGRGIAGGGIGAALEEEATGGGGSIGARGATGGGGSMGAACVA